MKTKTYKSKTRFNPVEVSDKAGKLVAKVNQITGIPKRRLVNDALVEYLPRKFAKELASQASD